MHNVKELLQQLEDIALAFKQVALDEFDRGYRAGLATAETTYTGMVGGRPFLEKTQEEWDAIANRDKEYSERET